MNNLEIKEDFLKLLAEIFPNTRLTEREDMLIGMAINHACLCLTHKEDEELEEWIKHANDFEQLYLQEHREKNALKRELEKLR